MKDSKSNHDTTHLNEVIKRELIERAIASNKAIAEGRVKNLKVIKEEIKSWGRS